MNCPICGAKVKNEICPYCEITNKQIIYASNKQAKEIRKEKKDQSKICYSSTMPKDVNKVKLWIFLIFGGWFGADSFLTGKYFKGLFCLFSYITIFMVGLLKTLADQYNWGTNAVDTFGALLSLMSIFGVVVFLMWFVGVIQMLTKKYKVPVVLPDKEVANQMHLEYTEIQHKKALEKEMEKQSKGKN